MQSSSLRPFKNTTSFFAGLVLALAAQLVSMSSARAICDEPRTVWDFDTSSTTELQGYATAWVANPIKPKLSIGKSIEARVDFSVSVGAEAGVILAKASTEFSVSVGASISRTVTEEYEGEKPKKGKLARIVVYAEARQFRVRKMSLRSPCKYVAGPWITVRAPKKNGRTIVRQQEKKDTRSSRVLGADGVADTDSVGDDAVIEEVELPYDAEVEELDVGDELEGLGDGEVEEAIGPDDSETGDEGLIEAPIEVGVGPRQEEALVSPRMLALAERHGFIGRRRGARFVRG